MDLVDEQHVALFEIGQQRREIAGLGDHRSRRRAKTDAEFARHDLRQSGLAEAGGADEQHMVERLIALAGGVDEDLQIGAGLRLADEFGQILRAQRGIADIIGAALGGYQAGGWVHIMMPVGRRPVLLGLERLDGKVLRHGCTPWRPPPRQPLQHIAKDCH